VRGEVTAQMDVNILVSEIVDGADVWTDAAGEL
jgi:hypothetical protein